MRSVRLAFVSSLLFLAAAATTAQEVNLLALGEGALPVEGAARATRGWPAVNLLDDAPGSGLAVRGGQADEQRLRLRAPGPGDVHGLRVRHRRRSTADRRGAKDVTVEVSAAARRRLRAGPAGQPRRPQGRAALPRLPKKVEGRFVRLTIVDNHGDAEVQRADGLPRLRRRVPAAPAACADSSGPSTPTTTQVPPPPAGDGDLRLLRVRRGPLRRHGRGPGREAHLDASRAGNARAGGARLRPGREELPAATGGTTPTRTAPSTAPGTGKRAERPTSAAARTGRAPWAGSCRKDLAARAAPASTESSSTPTRRACKPESLPTLDEVVRLLAGEPAWSLVIEGHTDSTSTAAHNQTLSEQRAAVGPGLPRRARASPPRALSSVGFGQSQARSPTTPPSSDGPRTAASSWCAAERGHTHESLRPRGRRRNGYG